MTAGEPARPNRRRVRALAPFAPLYAIPPPRGRPREGPMDSLFRIDCLDAERQLPVLVREAS